MRKKVERMTFNSDSQAMQDVFRLSLEEIRAVLSRQRKMSDVTKTAVVTLSNYTRVKATENNERALMQQLYLRGAEKETSAISEGAKTQKEEA